MSEINIIHPFREGNGRAIREYIRCLALTNGYIINWKLVDKSQLLNAMILSVDKNNAALADCIYSSFES